MRCAAVIFLVALSAGRIYATTANPVNPNCAPLCCDGPVRGDVDYLCSSGSFTCITQCRREQECFLESGPQRHDNYPCRWNFKLPLVGCRFDDGAALQNKCGTATIDCTCMQANACDDAACHMNPQGCFFSLECEVTEWR